MSDRQRTFLRLAEAELLRRLVEEGPPLTTGHFLSMIDLAHAYALIHVHDAQLPEHDCPVWGEAIARCWRAAQRGWLCGQAQG
jgi:hypothetical protein